MFGGMSVQIAVRLADEDLERLDAAIARGAFPSCAAAVRAGLAAVLRNAREEQIADAYRKAYASDEEEERIGEAGLSVGAAILAGQERAGVEDAQ
jgi:Arc/MetJ-type ribon-helix-helix transcriptional regulator